MKNKTQTLGIGLSLFVAITSWALEPPKGYRLLKEEIGKGANARVHLILSLKDQKEWAWKVPKEDTLEQREKLKRDAKLHGELKKAGVRTVHVEVVEDGHSEIKTFVNGPTISKALESEKFLDDAKHPKTQALIRFFKEVIQKKLFIGDLNPGNLMFENGEWVVVDCNKVEWGDSRKEVFKKYQEDLASRWRRKRAGGAWHAEQIAKFFETYEDELRK